MFDSIVDAQTAIDEWIVHYSTGRPHQGIGMVTPSERFALAVSDPLEPIEPVAPAEVAAPAGVQVEVVARKVSAAGTISLDTFRYLAGRWLAGHTVQVTCRDDGVLEIAHRGVHIASHARRFKPGPSPAPRPKVRQPRRPATVGVPVVRKVDGSGSLTFAGHQYRVGNPYKRMTATVTIVGGTVQIAVEGQLVRTHPTRPRQGARRVRQPDRQARTDQRRPITHPGRRGVTRLPEPGWNTGTGP